MTWAMKIAHVRVVHDESGRVWLMLHSGSRNIGNITAQNYDKIAQAQLTQQNIKVPGGLNYLVIDSKPGQEYLQVTWLEFFTLFLFHVSIYLFFSCLWFFAAPFTCQIDCHHAMTCDSGRR